MEGEDSSTNTAYCAWNEYLNKFFEDLIVTFPECSELLTAKDACDAMIMEDASSVMKKYLTEMAPHIEALVNKNEEEFFNAGIEFLEQLGAHKYWTDDLEQETKDSIWTYLQNLYVMGETINNIDPGMLQTLEQYADDLVKSGQNIDDLDQRTVGLGAVERIMRTNPDMASQFDPAALSTLQSMFGQAEGSSFQIPQVQQQSLFASMWQQQQQPQLQQQTPGAPAGVFNPYACVPNNGMNCVNGVCQMPQRNPVFPQQQQQFQQAPPVTQPVAQPQNLFFQTPANQIWAPGYVPQQTWPGQTTGQFGYAPNQNFFARK